MTLIADTIVNSTVLYHLSDVNDFVEVNIKPGIMFIQNKNKRSKQFPPNQGEFTLFSKIVYTTGMHVS